MKIAIVTDSSAYLTAAECQRYSITVVPIPFIMDDQVYREGIDLETTAFYEKLRVAATLPSTSQPPLGDMLRTYENIANAGYDVVLSIHLASTISGFYHTLQSVTPKVTGLKVVPYDSGITVRLLGYLVIAAARLAEQGADLATIISELDRLRGQINEVFIVNDLKNLARGGRLSNMSAALGSMLKIKPLLTFDQQTNKIVLFEKVRSLKRAYQHAEKIFADDLAHSPIPLRLLIIHANDPDAALAWQKKLQGQFPDVVTEVTYFGPVIGTHLGEKAIALGWMPDIFV
ncbi:DegV family protein [Lapidilactobacillus luobeiensis]|uniref:DegV family protein n=1 Tax=Lapidilactobacillus luobeiensis TaxID=2950371 RepID=UPI0021C394CE|nr:DegV family protein [Lapidilactobacillus luobeiensis]